MRVFCKEDADENTYTKGRKAYHGNDTGSFYMLILALKDACKDVCGKHASDKPGFLVCTTNSSTANVCAATIAALYTE
jgi:hypothetical protein